MEQALLKPFTEVAKPEMIGERGQPLQPDGRVEGGAGAALLHGGGSSFRPPAPWSVERSAVGSGPALGFLPAAFAHVSELARGRRASVGIDDGFRLRLVVSHFFGFVLHRRLPCD